MSTARVGGVETPRLRLFPLPYFVDSASMSPNRSARVVGRRRLTAAISSVSNRCIYTLNRMYCSMTCPLPPSPHSSPKQVKSSPPLTCLRRSSHNLSARSRHDSTVLSAPATRQQQRLVASIRQRCASFVLAVRSSVTHTTTEPSVGRTSEKDHVD
jgi:hypothetical protein